MDEDQSGRKILASRRGCLGICAPPNDGVRIASVVVGSGLQLFVSADGFASFAELEERPRQLLPGVIEAVVCGALRRYDSAAYFDRLLIALGADEHVRQEPLQIHRQRISAERRP